MVIASHAVFAAYGFWPPNDDRGSWSTHVWAPHLQRFGEAKTVSVRYSIAHILHDREHTRAIQGAMRFPSVKFNEEQRIAIADGIESVVKLLDVRLIALAILNDHVHLVPERHREDVETLVGFFKRAATRELTPHGIHPMGEARRARDGAAVTPWVRGGWKRSLDSWEAVEDAVEYVELNPLRAGMERQVYSFVCAPAPRSRGG
jgi:REP element-mobilizing transposase RayT